jgi:hypothetical protein
MGKQMVWSETEQRMVSATSKSKSKTAKVSISTTQFETLRNYAQRDGYDLSGVSYDVEKDQHGKTRHDKDGKVIFKLKDGKKIIRTVAESQGKVNSAVADYVSVAISLFIARQPKA